MNTYARNTLLILLGVIASLGLACGGGLTSTHARSAASASFGTIKNQGSTLVLPEQTITPVPQEVRHTSVSNPSTSQTGILTGSDNPILSEEGTKTNTTLSDSATLYGHIYYDASGNACGIGPTGICNMPFQKTFEIRDENNSFVRTVTSESNGSYSVVLNPGTYLIIPEPGSGVNPTAARQTVQLRANNSTEVTIVYFAIAMTNGLLP